MLRSRTILHSAAVVVLLVLTLSCGTAHESDEFFVLVSANLQLPYWKAAGAGFSNAAAHGAPGSASRFAKTRTNAP